MLTADWDETWKDLEAQGWTFNTPYYMPPGVDRFAKGENGKMKYTANVHMFTRRNLVMDYMRRTNGNEGNTGSNSNSNSSSSSSSSSNNNSSSSSSSSSSSGNSSSSSSISSSNSSGQGNGQESGVAQESWRDVLAIKSLQEKLVVCMDEDKHISYERPKVHGVKTCTEEQNELFCHALQYKWPDLSEEMESEIYYFAPDEAIAVRLMAKKHCVEEHDLILDLIAHFEQEIPEATERTQTQWERCLDANVEYEGGVDL